MCTVHCFGPIWKCGSDLTVTLQRKRSEGEGGYGIIHTVIVGLGYLHLAFDSVHHQLGHDHTAAYS